MLSTVEMGDHRHAGLQINLYGVQQETGRLLPDYDLKAGEVRRMGSHPVSVTPMFEVWEGEYLGKEKVSMKAIRGVEVTPMARQVTGGRTARLSTDGNCITQRFIREVKIWRAVWESDRGGIHPTLLRRVQQRWALSVSQMFS